jgi:hypothetical protein
MTNLESLREHIRMNYTTDAREEIAWAVGEIERMESMLQRAHPIRHAAIKLTIRDGIGYIESETQAGYSLTSATPAEYVAEIERLQQENAGLIHDNERLMKSLNGEVNESERLRREVQHLRETCASWGIVPARLAEPQPTPLADSVIDEIEARSRSGNT